MIDLSPIALFVYNRPFHTAKTLESLRNNIQADDSELFIFCDGPKRNAEKEEMKCIQDVRDVIREKKWCGKVHIIESESNKGLANSIIFGVSKIANDYGKVIVLEDDLVLSPFFLQYMNDALLKYEEIDRVMQICGYMFPIDNKGLKETFFLRLTSSWGWATWKRAWLKFVDNVNELYKCFPDKVKHRFNLDGAYDYFSFFKLQKENKIDSWAIRWYASVFLQNGLCLHPSESLLINIGNDDSGVHSKQTNVYDTTLYKQKVEFFENEIKENNEALERIKKFFYRTSRQSTDKKIYSFFRSWKK